jgi:Raf kinase inhibitor-like YbhB/YbcL family protein
VTRRNKKNTSIRWMISMFVWLALGTTLLVSCSGSQSEPTASTTSEPAAASPIQPTADQAEIESPIESTPTPAKESETGENDFRLTSEAFTHEEAIPTRYSCDGEDLSPPLAWHNAPEGTVSFALINDDPDAPVGTWVHWVLFNIPSTTTALAEDVSPELEFEDGSRHGENSWRRTDYGGPCPPGGTHRYIFKLYALDTQLDFDNAPTKEELLQAMEGHILAETELMGTYAR